ncbi:hypothetical protein WA026_010388 [Henosepilachna vigintioctopunctata]|uniref:Nodal modulator 1 n=1 Tax=Henosepilachna vigintioctopunctata TaxID=420089 RepID=A0AAW1VDX4_9CUCU
MRVLLIFFLILPSSLANTSSNDVLGCGGFVKSHVQIDFSKVEVKLLTKQGILKDKTTCAPNNGYYFLPIYDKGDYVLELNPPAGWSFDPLKVDLTIDRVNDLCSKGVDINFNFKGFGIAGRVESYGDSSSGPEGIMVELKTEGETRNTITSIGGMFTFTPVYPGQYKINIQHPRWKILKSELQLTVTEGNTDLPPKSLIVHGYSISGFAKSEGVPVSNATILLFSKKEKFNPDDVSGCDKTPLSGANVPKKILCHVKTNSNGQFIFQSVATGDYYVTPFYFNQNIDVEPSKIDFTVPHEDIELQHYFEVIGFSVAGKIVRSLDSLEGIPNAKIFVGGKFTTQTDFKGTYRLEKLKTGVFKIKVEAENLLFEETVLKINPNLQALPDIAPSAFKICGKVESEQSQLVTIVKVGSTFLKNVFTNPQSRKFCEYLPRGTYEVQVQVKQTEQEKGLQFYPILQKIVVFNEDDNIVLFSQLKATILGRIECNREDDYKELRVILKSTQSADEKAVLTKLQGQSYQFEEVFPGLYQLSLSPNKLCWIRDTYEILINTISVTAPTFVQTGYLVNFVSSHDTKVSYNLIGDSSINGHIDIKNGQSTYCLPKDGSYVFEYLGCHFYTNNTFTFNTQTESNELMLNAAAHLNRMCITSDANYGTVMVSIDIDGEKIQEGPLPYKDGCYTLEIVLEPELNAIILPQSEIYHFKPPIFRITGKNDCSDFGPVISAVKGRVFRGKVVPALPSTLITLEDDDGESSTTETDSAGFYKFPPMDQSKKYKITAKKESYQLVGPTENGDFSAFKLAQIIVDVLGEHEKSPLQGTLLSLSGGHSYRSNLQTDEHGKIIFHSLSPSEYYLRPMMKEYSFEPASKIINVEEGEVINITLIGKRIAYSAFGHVTSLNGIPEHNSVVEAVGIGNCSHLSEETTTESDGGFRIRGLLPSCTYHLKTRDPSVVQCVPEFIEIKDIGDDINSLHLIVLRPTKRTKVMVKVFSNEPEYFKMLKLCVYHKGPSSTLVHSIRLDSYIKVGKEPGYLNPGIMIVHLPPLPKDGKTYVLQLETASSQNLKWITQSASMVANTSFKFVQLEFSVKSNITEQQIKQTSIWNLILIIISLIIAYNIHVILRLINEKFDIKLSSLGSIIKNKISTSADCPANDMDIDQIVQSINSVKRKPKRS